ncbi:MAG: LysE family translocator [Alphaproteobacteria bacterium]|nr:LysE family translocator [Alphaproteobacteria bacterium]MDD9920577.1 LysE family translocator [Alphaproteobacteria bacterium]
MDFHTWAAFVVSSIALLLIPGPTVLLVLSYAISQGKNAALATATGVALGDFIAMSASLAGLGTLVLASSTLFTVLKWVGAIYLVYLGIKLLCSKPTPISSDIADVNKTNTLKIFGHATTVTALNPKSIVFFIAFVPQFITVGNPLIPQFLILITTFVGLATVNTLAYVFMGNKLRTTIASPSTLLWLSRFGGSTLIAMGLATATFKRAQ